MSDIKLNEVVLTNSPLHPKAKAEKTVLDDDKQLFFDVVYKGPGSKTGFCSVDSDGTSFDVKQEMLFQLNDPKIDNLKFRDIGELVHKNPAAVLHFLGERLKQKEIYTMAEPLLIACNPYTDPGNASDKCIQEYIKAKDIRKLKPHNFLIARRALATLHGARKPQTIMVSGESGAGKTESTKLIMRYCAAGTSEGKIQKAIMSANPVLEAFGNAMTVRNNNSSRFGRFMMLDVKPSGGFRYGSIENFLLEKSRIISQGEGERSYHIFYQLLKASKHKDVLGISCGQTGFRSITSSVTDAPGIDDHLEHSDVCDSLKAMMMNEDEIMTVWKVLAAVLHLGNVRFGTGEHSVMEDEQSLELACSLLDVPRTGDAGIQHNVMNKTLNMPGQAPVVKPLSPRESTMLLHSLARSLYDELFIWIVRKLNSNIEPPGGFSGSGTPFLALLDIFGFEVFKNNSLEQMFINITNERLQKKFIDVVFQKEIELYKSEAINTKILDEITWSDNDHVIDCLIGISGTKGPNCMSCLSDCCMSPGKPEDKDNQLVNSFGNKLKANPHYIPSKFNGGGEFIIDHTIGHVQYNADGFVAKNTDILKFELVDLLKNHSGNPTVKALYGTNNTPKGSLGKDNLINMQFVKQLERLMSIIDKTETHFVRCVKPNERKAKLTPIWGKMFQQLTALSIIDAINLSKLGYSYRRPFSDYVEQFKFANLGITESNRDDKTKATELLKSCKLSDKDYQIGKTMVFMTEDGLRTMNRVAHDALSQWKPVVVVLESLWWRRFYKRKHDVALPLIERLQIQIRLKIKAMTGEGL